jgi:hypothetical protein
LPAMAFDLRQLAVLRDPLCRYHSASLVPRRSTTRTTSIPIVAA